MQKTKTQAELLQEQAAAQAAEQAQQQQQQPVNQQPQQFGMPYRPQAFGQPINPQGFGQPIPQPQLQGTAAEQPAVEAPNMNEFIEQLEAAKKEHDEDSAELRKHSRAQGIVGGIADASSALANLIFAGQNYSPNMYDPKNSMSEKAYERYQKAKAQLDKTHADKLAYLERIQKQRNADRTADIQNRRLDYLIQQEADRAKAKEQEYELNNAKFEWKKKMDEGKMTLDQAKYELDKLVRMGKLSLERAGLIKHELEDYDKEITIHRDLSGKEIGRTETRRVKHKDGTTTTESSEKRSLPGAGNSNTSESQQGSSNKKQLPGR